ncbi:trehalose operon repressor [Virgibacillus halophilus]|uniref:Trehalose operon repressor n=1 Tax=Tigheibacillus halophilus TaxID=361280 RepID=A0ABU5C7Q8_9BACI|nr:trehalose operon repressor [Virgibacillus halophilus]
MTSEKKMKENDWRETDMLPSENELSIMYGTSRETIRKALNLLSQNGYIQKVRGKGSIILAMDKFSFPVSGIASFKELTKMLDMQSRTYVQELSLAKADEAMRKILDPAEEELVWKVVRVRELDGEKVILDKDYFKQGIVNSLTKDICEDSIYAYLEQELHLDISYANKEITVESPTEEDMELMDMTGFSNVVVIKSIVHLNNTEVFQYTESRHRPDKFRFVDFARRHG